MNSSDRNPTFIIDIPVADEVVQIQSFQSRCWVCHISVPSLADEYSMELSVSLSYQSDHHSCDNQSILDYAQLRILSGLSNGSSSLVLEMPFQLPQVLLHGLQVQIDPNMVKSCDHRYLFRIFIESNSAYALSCNRQLEITSQPSDFRIASCLASSQVSMDTKHLMRELLERAVNADIQLSFCNPRQSHGSKRLTSGYENNNAAFPRRQDNNCILHTHSCVLKTVGTMPMERLLNTFPPSDDQFNQISSFGNVDLCGYISAMEPIREIRFEDSSPAAVEAVIRYIYLGQPPVLEPLCGYTVRDLMSLASYLEIESLQDHCVELVLGTSVGCDYEIRSDRNTATRRRAIQFGRSSIQTDDGNHRPPHWRMDRQQIQIQKRQIKAETAMQLLFGWGYRFPKIRRALIQALIHDHGYIFADGKLIALERFRDHIEFNAILYELVAEQFRCTAVNCMK